MTPDRAREILETGREAGNFSRQMTATELAELDALWARLQRSTSYEELLTMIAAGKID